MFLGVTSKGLNTEAVRLCGCVEMMEVYFHGSLQREPVLEGPTGSS